MLLGLRYSCWLILALLLPMHGSAQQRAPMGKIEHGFRPLLAHVTEKNRPDRTYREAEQRFSSGAFDPAAEELRQAAERFTKAFLIVPSLRFQSATTSRTEHGDDMLCRWSFDEAYGKGTIILDDTPQRSTYHVRLSDYKWDAAEGPHKLAQSLLYMNQPPLRIDPARSYFQIHGSPSSPLGFSWTFSPLIPSPYPGILDFDLYGVLAGTEWYLTLNMGKGWTGGYYPIRGFIPERFPPLMSLAREWDWDRLRAELARPFGDPPSSNGRDTVLLREWARRGMTAEQVAQLLGDGVARVDQEWYADQVLRTVDKSTAPVPIATYLDSALRALERIGTRSEASVNLLLRRAGGKACRPEIEADALRWLRDGIFLQGPIYYLGACAHSQEAIDALEHPQLPAWVKADREASLKRIRARRGDPAVPR